MGPPLFSLFLKYAFLAFEAQQVIAIRMMRIAVGGALAERELQRMISEKALAASQAGFEAVLSLTGGKSSTAIAHGAIRGYRTRVRKNRRRLSGG